MISKGETYYFNNGKVTILKVETDNFVLVCGDKDIHTEVNGSEFCHGCMVGKVEFSELAKAISQSNCIVVRKGK